VQNCQRGCMDQIAPQLEAIKAGLSAAPSEADQKVMQVQVLSHAVKKVGLARAV